MLLHRKTKRLQNKVTNLITLRKVKRNKRKAMLLNFAKQVGA